MLAWIYNLIVGQFCNHKWVIIASGTRSENGSITGNYYDCKCKKCGRIKEFKT